MSRLRDNAEAGYGTFIWLVVLYLKVLDGVLMILEWTRSRVVLNKIIVLSHG